MKSNLVSASVIAVSALAFFGSASSFAEGRDPFPQDQVSATSTKSRAEVRAELAQAQREGYSVNIAPNYQAPESAALVSTKSRADVKAELLQAQREGYSVNISPTYQDVYTAHASGKTRADVKAEIGTTVSSAALDRDYPVVQ